MFFLTLFVSIYYLFSGTTIDLILLNPGVMIIFLSFVLIGLVIFISGLKEIIKNNKTRKHGMQCYGIISDIQHSGSYINGCPEYIVKVTFVNPETYQIDTTSEITGFNYNKYPINSYISCRYYQGDVNIIGIVSENEIPSSIKKNLPLVELGENGTNIKYSDNKEYVNINGIDYKRVR